MRLPWNSLLIETVLCLIFVSLTFKFYRMKSFLAIFTFLFLICSVVAQTTEGHVSYTITSSTNNPDMQMVIGMMDGSKMDIYFTPEATRTDVKMGLMMSVISITDLKTKEVVSLMDGMGSKFATKNTIPNMVENADTSKVEITYTEETKTILDLPCKKAIVKSEEGIETYFWFTESIKINVEGQNYFNSRVPGFPMEFEINNNGLTMKFTAASIEKELAKKSKSTLFDMTIPEGYEVKTTEELMQMGR